MSGLIKVNPDQLRSVATEIKNHAVDYESAYNKLYSSVETMANGWQGEDNLAFTNQIEGFKEDFQNMKKLMEEYASFLEISAKNYDGTQDNIASQATRLTN